jgi:hypothetical protein
MKAPIFFICILLLAVAAGAPAAADHDSDRRPVTKHRDRFDPAGVVKSLNGLAGNVTVLGGSNVTVRRVGVTDLIGVIKFAGLGS